MESIRIPRSYGDPCGIARALDLVGERWALLIVRELLLGPKRFTDLRAGLPSASPNVVSQRLHELEQAGIVRRRKLGPPASIWVYELTDWGLDLEPVVLALGRWGSRSPSVPAAELSVDALILALKTVFDPRAAGGLRAQFELRLGEERFHAVVANGQIELARGGANHPDATIETDIATFRGLVFGDRQLSEALRAGDVTLEGDQQAVTHFLRLFPRPAPIQPA
ncbi:MAG: transcriptional regulator, HxlR family [Chloroflexi bacterium]|nr:transcriptional regulator, HxlR family [Chloroflexota bacterium]